MIVVRTHALAGLEYDLSAKRIFIGSADKMIGVVLC